MHEASEMNGTTMQKTILLTGATDGIGFETARLLFEQGHRVLLHGRSPEKLVDTEKTLNALAGQVRLEDYEAYAQSKLALTMWSRHLALELGKNGPVIVAVNPGSLLASKMVKEGFGVAGNDIRIGADILVRAALSDEFADASGQYFDNDAGQFNPPHPDALNPATTDKVVKAMKAGISKLV